VSQPVDVLAFGAHPDDVELTVGGTMLLARAQGLRTAVVHFTLGEMGTRGTPETRREEATAAAAVLQADHLDFLGLRDGHLQVDDESKEAVIRALRRFRPRVVLAPYFEDLHPDHEAAGNIIRKAAFLSGLEKWDTGQEPWRPDSVLYYMSHHQFDPHLIVDVSPYFAAKREAAACYVSQLHNPESTERQTYIAGSSFWDWWEGRARHWGHQIGVEYGEPYHLPGPLPSRNPFELFSGFGKYKNS